MECKLQNRYKLITDYVTGELSEEKAKAFEEHYFQCDTCFNELRAAEAAMSLIEKEGAAAFANERPRQRKMRRPVANKFHPPHFSGWKQQGFAIATAAAAVICIMVISILFIKQESPQLSGINFEPNPYYEEWIMETTRSEGEKFEAVHSPKNGEQFEDQEIVFQWETAERLPLTLKILTNAEEEVMTLTPQPSDYPVFTEKVSPQVFGNSGLYYWRLEDNSEVLCVGKFYFLK